MKKFERCVYFGFMILLVVVFIWHLARDLYEHDTKQFEADMIPPVYIDVGALDPNDPAQVVMDKEDR